MALHYKVIIYFQKAYHYLVMNAAFLWSVLEGYHNYPGVPHTLAKYAICYCILASLWLLVPGLSGHYFSYNWVAKSATVGNGYKIL